MSDYKECYESAIDTCTKQADELNKNRCKLICYEKELKRVKKKINNLIDNIDERVRCSMKEMEDEQPQKEPDGK